MDILERSLRSRVFTALFITIGGFLGASLAQGSAVWTFLIVGVPLTFVAQLLGDAVTRRLDWWPA